MNTFRRCLLLSCLVCFSGCRQSAPPTPKKSAFLKGLDPGETMKLVAPKELGWSWPSQRGVGTASPGKGQWDYTWRFMIHGEEKSVDVLMRALHDELRGKAEKLLGTKVDGFTERAGNAERPDESLFTAFQLNYAVGGCQGKVVGKIEPPPANAHILDGRKATHQLTIEVTESYQDQR
jgi:hypothetical protein